MQQQAEGFDIPLEDLRLEDLPETRQSLIRKVAAISNERLGATSPDEPTYLVKEVS